MNRPFEAAAPAVKVWDVAALVLAIGDALNARFPALAVRGEIAAFSRAASGHCYFALKDAEGRAAIRCVMFRRAAALAGFEPRDGDEVELRGRLAVYEARGELQLVAESIRRAGDGALLERFRRLRAELDAEGLFDDARKRPIPAHPRALAVVTSTAAAALHDVLASFARRAPQVALHVFPAPVQGTGAATALAEALAAAGRSGLVDAVLLVRGGGSLEDLWAYNEPVLVRAVAACGVPVIAGIGHETDVTLADLAADLRAPTPTAAAELATPSRAQLAIALDTLAERGRRALRRRLEAQAQAVDRHALRVARPARALANARERLLALRERHANAAQRVLRVERQRQAAALHRLAAAATRSSSLAARRLELAGARLAALDPQRVLARGYAWLSDDDGRTLVSATAVAPGQRVRARLADGAIDASVLAVRLDDERA
ncbi:exodeoxyribonuclease VII large subunit [Methylibium sp.]|uniref:exodeoxyribonuclease VII large subunit n=1 Tax=Methylibium sp. TaxID=2067992 RepID=UPI0039C99B88